MSNINKQELREAAERAESDSWGYDRDEFNEALTPSTVLALLDELEAKDKQIADLKEAFSIALSAAGIDSPAAAGKGEASWKLSPLAGLTNAVAATNPTRSKLLAGMKPPCGMTIE